MEPVETPEMLSGVRLNQRTPVGNVHVLIVVDVKTGKELEIFAQVGKSAGLPSSNLEALCRMISLFLRIGGTLAEVQKQLEGICANEEHTVLTKEGKVTSVADGLGKAIRRYRKLKEKHGLPVLLTGGIDLDGKESGAS